MKKMIPLAVLTVLFFVQNPLRAITAEIQWSEESDKTMSRLDASDYCSNLEEDGGGNWRLPTSKEMRNARGKSKEFWVADNEEIEKDYDNEEEKKWGYSFEENEKFPLFVSTKLKVVCVREKNRVGKTQIVAIENTKDVQSANARADYAEKKARDAEERAKQAEIEKNLMKKQTEADQEACNYARQEGSKSGWQLYLKQFPNGDCSTEAEWTIRKLKKNTALDLKLLNSDYYGTYDKIDSYDKFNREFWPLLFGFFPVAAGAVLLPIGLWGDEDLVGADDEGKKTKRECIISGSIVLGIGSVLMITGTTYAVWDDYTKGERAAGFMISFGALIAAGGGTMVGLAEGDEFMFYGGIATAAVGAGMLIGGITMAALDARARELKKKNGYSFSVLPNKDGFYAQMNLNF